MPKRLGVTGSALYAVPMKRRKNIVKCTCQRPTKNGSGELDLQLTPTCQVMLQSIEQEVLEGKNKHARMLSRELSDISRDSIEVRFQKSSDTVPP